MLLVLWDVDNTLINNGGVSKDTYALAFELLTGVKPTLKARTDGRTDPEIIVDMFERHRIPATEAHLSRLHEALIEAMAAKAEILLARGRALDGAHEAIEALKNESHLVQSVLSGNIKNNAFAKLATFHLERDLDWDVGALGSDGNVRSALVKVAQGRAGRKYGTDFAAPNTVLIGDTTRDVRAGREGGARVIGVATGTDSAEVLRAEGADVVLDSLSDACAVVAAVRRAHVKPRP